MLPPPKTPEVVLLEEFPVHRSGKRSCSTPQSSSGDMTGLYTSGMDLFGNMDDHRSPGIYPNFFLHRPFVYVAFQFH